MIRRTAPLVALLAVTVLPGALRAQGFAERAGDFGLLHEFIPGADQVADLKLYDMLQAGISVADVDGDGDCDVLAFGGLGHNTLLLNTGGVFTDASASAGIEVGDFDRIGAVGDYDGDGRLDLWIGVLEGGDGAIPGKGRMYRGAGDGTFEEVTALAWARGAGHSLFAQWNDLDRDGLLDLYVNEFHGTPNVWYRNNGDGSFSERSVEMGIAHWGSAHASCIADYDQDGYPDLVVGNDHTISKVGKLQTQDVDGVYYGQADGTLLDLSDNSGADIKGGIMGCSLGDVNYDGLMDVYKTNVNSNNLMINHGWPTGPAWTEEEFAYGIDNMSVPCATCPGGFGKSVGWGAAFFHADLDPWLDLYVTNGQVSGLSTTTPFSSRNQQNFLYRGLGPGAGFTFVDDSAAFGLDDTIDDRALALGDLDDDGDPDLLVGPTTGALRYYENQVDHGTGGWIGVTAQTGTSAPGGVGTEIRWTDSLGYPHVYVLGGDGITASQSEWRAFLAIGSAASVDVTAKFPSGYERTYPGVLPGTELVVEEPVFVRTSARTLPIAGASVPGVGGGLGTPGGTGPAGIYAVTAFASELGGASVVTIDVPGLTPLSAVIALGGERYRRYFAAPATPGTYRAQVAFDAFALRIEPQVHFYDPHDASGTSVLLDPEAVRAGSADTAVVTFAPKTADGIALGAGRVVTVQSATLTVLDGPNDLGDGRYRVTLAAPLTSGLHELELLLDGAPVATATLEAGGAPHQQMTEFRFEDPLDVQSAAPDRARLYITPRDADGYRLGPKAVVTVDPLEDPFMDEVTPRTDLWSEGQRDGSFFFVFEVPPGSPDNAVQGDFQITVDGVVFSLQPFAI